MDDITITDLVQQEIQRSVSRYVESVLADQQWKHQLEQQITDCVQQRIAARFQNICDIPAIVTTVEQAVNNLFDQGKIPGIEHLVDPNQLQHKIDSSTQQLVNRGLDTLIQDADWIDKIQTNIETNLISRASALVSGIDIGSVVSSEVQARLELWKTQILDEWRHRGIQDEASKCELLITDGAVVAQSGLACDNLMVGQDLVTRNLVVTGVVNTDCDSWNELADAVSLRTQKLLGEKWQQQLIDQVLDLAKEQGIDFNQVLIQGRALVSGDTLNPSITMTSIQQLGVLKDLRVEGTVNLSNTLTAGDRRVGINTNSPDMALSLWDEEISISMGKISRDRGWIGSNRQQALDIGVNRRRSISIESDGLVAIDKLRLDRWRISFGNAVPNYSGTRGDLVINHDPRPNTPFAWQCMGAFQWRTITL